MSKRLLPALLLFASATAHAQDLTPYLDQKLISSKGMTGFTYERHQLCGDKQHTFQATGSRLVGADFFLLVTGMIEGHMIQEMHRTPCSRIEQPIGQPDVVTTADMTKEGIRLTAVDHQRNKRLSKSMLWTEFSTKNLFE